MKQFLLVLLMASLAILSTNCTTNNPISYQTVAFDTTVNVVDTMQNAYYYTVNLATHKLPADSFMSVNLPMWSQDSMKNIPSDSVLFVAGLNPTLLDTAKFERTIYPSGYSLVRGDTLYMSTFDAMFPGSKSMSLEFHRVVNLPKRHL